MALTPENNDAFVREVDEELRREQLTTFWKRYGRTLLIAIVVGLLLLAGYLWWQSEQQKARDADGETLTIALQGLAQGQNDVAKTKLEELASSKNAAYRATAKLSQAAVLLGEGNVAEAAKAYGAIAADEDLAQPFRDLAVIRQTAAEFDTLPPQTVIDRLKPYSVESNAWFGSAGEMTGLAYLKLGKTNEAAAIFGKLAKNQNVPETLRGRAVRMAGALGIDLVVQPGDELNGNVGASSANAEPTAKE